MLFEKTDDEPEKIRVEDPDFGKGFKGFKWITLRKGSIIDLLEEYGLRLGLVPVKKVENNSKNNEESKDDQEKTDSESDLKKKEILLYKENLESIKGIGKKTAKDLIRVYPTEKDIIKELKSGKELPIRDDLTKLIKKKFNVE